MGIKDSWCARLEALCGKKHQTTVRAAITEAQNGRKPKVTAAPALEDTEQRLTRGQKKAAANAALLASGGAVDALPAPITKPVAKAKAPAKGDAFCFAYQTNTCKLGDTCKYCLLYTSDAADDLLGLDCG